MPHEVSLIIVVAWKREEEGRTIKTVLLAKLCKLFRRCLFAEHSNSRITGNELDQECNERDDGPNNEYKDQQSFQEAHRRA